MTPQELVQKIDYEGGIYDAVAGYGLHKKSLSSATSAQVKAWNKVVDLCLRLSDAVDAMYAIFPDISSEEDL